MNVTNSISEYSSEYADDSVSSSSAGLDTDGQRKMKTKIMRFSFGPMKIMTQLNMARI